MKNTVKASIMGLGILGCVSCSQVVDFPQETGGSGGTTNVSITSTGSHTTTSSTASVTPDPCDHVTCGEGKHCVDGQCVKHDPCDGVCCPEGQVCQDGVCIIPDPCDGVCCPDGQQCVDGECITPDPCQDVQCCEGEECVDGECVPKDPCAGVQCSEGKKCVDGQCVCDGEPSDWCGSGKTKLCHYPPGNWSNRHNICVGNPAVPAHLNHGDKLGDCSYYN